MSIERARAAYFALRDPDDYPAGQCVAWMDSADRTCNKPTDTYLCPMHHRVASRRIEKDRAKQRAQYERELRMLEPNLSAWVEQRDSLVAQRDRVASLKRHDTDDPAAYGGIGIRQTERQRRQYARRFDKALDEYGRLTRRIEALDDKIARVHWLQERA